MIHILDSNVNNILTALWHTIVSMTAHVMGMLFQPLIWESLLECLQWSGGILIFASITAVISSLYMSRISRDNHDELKSKIDELNSEIEKLNKKIDEL